MSVRISLIERLAVEANGSRLDEQRFPGRQGRIVFAYLTVHRGRAVPRGELAEVIWGEDLPATWEKALRVLMTKLRPLLEECGIDRTTGLTSAFGCYTLTLPADTWIDVEAAKAAIERADAAFAAGDLDEARAHASAAAGLSRPNFLPGEDGTWVEEQRRDLREILVQALECLRDASLATQDFGDAVRHATEIINLEPFRESSYRALMEAHVAAGNPAEALRVYERCRRFLADELGAYPSAESEAVYLEILRSSSGPHAATADPVAESGSRPGDERPRRGRRRTALVGALLLAGVATVAGLAFTSRDNPPPEILPNSLVRLDPETLEPKHVIPIGPEADQVVVADGYVWVAHASLHHGRAFGDTGNRTLIRVDPSTGEARDVGNGLAACGITPDPSGDVWVANCYASGPKDKVVRVDARTLEFEQTQKVPARPGYYRGIAYGGGSVWVADPSGSAPETPEGRRLTQLDARIPSSSSHSIRLKRHATALTWDEGNGSLWMSNFNDGSVTRLDVETGVKKTFKHVANSPGPVAVKDDVVWVGDWDIPRVVHFPAVGSGRRRSIRLPATRHPAGVTSIAADANGIWAAVPEDRAVVRIDPKTYRTQRAPLPYAPWGVAIGDDGIWVTLRSTE